MIPHHLTDAALRWLDRDDPYRGSTIPDVLRYRWGVEVAIGRPLSRPLAGGTVATVDTATILVIVGAGRFPVTAAALVDYQAAAVRDVAEWLDRYAALAMGRVEHHHV